MEKRSQVDTAALFGRIDALQVQLSEMQTDLSKLRLGVTTQISEILELLHKTPVLTSISNVRYTQGNIIQSQEQNGVVMNSNVVYGAHEDLGEDKNNPPLVPEGTELTCIRCGYKWTPYARRPQQCAKCRAPWWFPPKWRWHQSQGESP